MTNKSTIRRVSSAVSLVGLLLLACMAAGAATASGAGSKPAMSHEEQLRYGERMYREGILPNGKPMQALVQGDVPVSGSSFTCVSCHLRSGLGATEGTVVTPPTNGRVLFQPRGLLQKNFEMVPTVRKYSLSLPQRPAYTDETLAECIAGGVDPAGRELSRTMPRYHLNEADMAMLIAYLKTLSDRLPPGVSETEMHFATVITDGVRPEDVQAMLLPIETYISKKNGIASAFKRRPQSMRMAVNMMGPDLVAMKMSLSRWHLKGAPDTWRAQLEEYYKKDPVFALLGGIGNGSWEPIHRFCEDHRLPDLFPVTDYPVISSKDWYTLYISKGVFQEGEGAARYLNTMHELLKGKTILQVVRTTRRGKALATGFLSTWKAFGWPAPVTVELSADQPLTPPLLDRLLTKEKPAVLLVWDDAAALPAVAALAHRADRPGMVVMSAVSLGPELRHIPDAARSYLYLTYPYRLPQDDVRYDSFIDFLIKGKSFDEQALRIVKQSYALGALQSQALMEMRGEYYRDFLLDTIGMMPDMDLPLYERLSFGPNQRYASKGCYIVQLGKGDKPELVKRSDWAIR